MEEEKEIKKVLDLKAIKDFADYAQSKHVQASVVQSDDELSPADMHKLVFEIFTDLQVRILKKLGPSEYRKTLPQSEMPL